jgi:hypothetical protein
MQVKRVKLPPPVPNYKLRRFGSSEYGLSGYLQPRGQLRKRASLSDTSRMSYSTFNTMSSDVMEAPEVVQFLTATTSAAAPGSGMSSLLAPSSSQGPAEGSAMSEGGVKGGSWKKGEDCIEEGDEFSLSHHTHSRTHTRQNSYSEGCSKAPQGTLDGTLQALEVAGRAHTGSALSLEPCMDNSAKVDALTNAKEQDLDIVRALLHAEERGRASAPRHQFHGQVEVRVRAEPAHVPQQKEEAGQARDMAHLELQAVEAGEQIARQRAVADRARGLQERQASDKLAAAQWQLEQDEARRQELKAAEARASEEVLKMRASRLAKEFARNKAAKEAAEVEAAVYAEAAATAAAARVQASSCFEAPADAIVTLRCRPAGRVAAQGKSEQGRLASPSLMPTFDEAETVALARAAPSQLAQFSCNPSDAGFDEDAAPSSPESYTPGAATAEEQPYRGAEEDGLAELGGGSPPSSTPHLDDSPLSMTPGIDEHSLACEPTRETSSKVEDARKLFERASVTSSNGPDTARSNYACGVDVRYVRTPALLVPEPVKLSCPKGTRPATADHFESSTDAPLPEALFENTVRHHNGSVRSGGDAVYSVHTSDSGVAADASPQSICLDGHVDGNGFRGRVAPHEVLKASFVASEQTFLQHQQALKHLHEGAEAMLPGFPRAVTELEFVGSPRLSSVGSRREARMSAADHGAVLPRSGGGKDGAARPYPLGDNELLGSLRDHVRAWRLSAAAGSRPEGVHATSPTGV